MDVSILCKRAGAGGDPELLRKAKEFLRRLKNLRTALDPEEALCKPAICIELAGTTLKKAIDRKRLVRCSAVTEKVYSRSLRIVQNYLGIFVGPDLNALILKFGLERVRGKVLKLYQTYQQRFLKTLDDDQKAKAKFSRSVFPAVAIFCISKESDTLKAVDKAAIIQASGCDSIDFCEVLESMLRLCPDILDASKFHKDQASYRGELDNSYSNEICDDIDENYETPGVVQSKRAREAIDKQEWKDKVLQNVGQAGQNGPARHTKQARLTFSSLNK